MQEEVVNRKNTAFLLLITGFILVFMRFFTILLPIRPLFEALLFGFTAFLLGNHVDKGKWTWGLLLAAPAMLLQFYLILTAEGSSFDPVNIISIILIPLSCCLGIWLKAHRKRQHAM